MATVPQPRETEVADTCGRCGLRRATKELEEQGIQIRLCDDCYWGQEPQQPVRTDTPPAA